MISLMISLMISRRLGRPADKNIHNGTTTTTTTTTTAATTRTTRVGWVGRRPLGRLIFNIINRHLQLIRYLIKKVRLRALKREAIEFLREK